MFALLAAVCWAGCVIPFARATKLVGALPVNLIRLVMTVLFLTGYGFIAHGNLLPTDANAHNWLWLSLSGFAGFFVGDLFGFRALVLIGPRLSTLIAASLAPPVAAIVGWIWIGESMGLMKVVGMATIIAGVSWVVMEGPVYQHAEAYRVTPYGVFCGLVAAVSKGVGLVMSKVGMKIMPAGATLADMAKLPDYDAVSATQIRAFAAVLSLAVFMFLLKPSGGLVRSVKNSKAMLYTFLAALIGPTIGVVFMLRSLQTVSSGVVQTLIGITPILVLPMVMVFEKERIGRRAVLGTTVAVLGVGLLVLTREDLLAVFGS
jgi:drug/metabolite transporter (DMT)-like permease